MPVYHGTDEFSARDIVANGLNQQAWERAAGGAGPDPKGFSVTDNLAHAQDWAHWRAQERLGTAGTGVVLEADEHDLPLFAGQPGQWADPGERFIRIEDFSQVGPGVFREVP